ncbi:DASH family cryptochrome [Marinobacterium weihaiense]|uniref:Cryptochrome DASH n=1 Tax=Marinobacterium weihaiense TaxID=2851016 RepID=A0ABS6MEU1_9GAMM|nr:DASH family cryptochrome [Marinobacterium weihaiense]MBV0934331.1 DASH family cryptochrome [Marinobacterium weihaiense]
MNTGLYWFTHDLRLDDNPALQQAARQCDYLLVVYVQDPSLERPDTFNTARLGSKRKHFLIEGLHDLAQQLQTCGQQLHCLTGNPVDVLTDLISQLGIDRLYCTRPVGWYEQRQLSELSHRFPHLQPVTADAYTLFDQAQMAELLDPFPVSFSAFRRRVEKKLTLPAPLPPVRDFPPMPRVAIDAAAPILKPDTADNGWFKGGELAAQTHLQRYFSSSLPATYKQVRNELDGLDNGTRFSPWLAQGSLSPRRVMRQLQQYEQRETANESTYWIFFELLWREYFQWYARHHDHRLYHLHGIQQRSPLTSFYPQRFKSWCEGSTPWPLVNACMKQLKATGWMSNRGRQIVASCLVNELALDWRYGAAWFEQELLDYDVASNWGNWQYLAGVGADPRGKRRFDIAKQTRQYDPQGDFIHRWQGEAQTLALDHVDAADWPIPVRH